MLYNNTDIANKPIDKRVFYNKEKSCKAIWIVRTHTLVSQELVIALALRRPIQLGNSRNTKLSVRNPKFISRENSFAKNMHCLIAL